MGSNTPSHRRRHDGRIKRAMKIRIAHEFMMCGRMVFREVVCNVGSPRGPVKIELLLSNTIFEPMITHVKGFRSFHADLGTENAISSGIVSLKWSGRLWMPHFGESSTHGNSLLGIEEETAGFSLRSRGSNRAYSSAKNMDGTIKLGSGRQAGCTREIGIIEEDSGIIEEDSGDLLDTFDSKTVKERREIRVSKLNFLAVHRGCPAMWGVLGTSWGGMTQSKKGFGNVVWHGNVNMASSIIPGNCEPKVAGPGPVLGECIPGGKSIKEVISIGLGEEFDTKVVDGKGKSGASISVAPETRGLGNWEVSVRGKVRLELIVRKDGSLFEAIHAFADL